MTDTIEVNGEEYDIDDNPSLGTVREVQSMQMDIIRNHIGEEELMQLDSLEDEGEIIQAILDSEGYEGLQDTMWERSMLENVQTISLAADEQFSPDDFDEIGAKDYKALREKCEDALGGSASDFFNDLGLGSLLNEEEMKRRATAAAANET